MLPMTLPIHTHATPDISPALIIFIFFQKMQSLLSNGVTTFPVLDNPSYWRDTLVQTFANDPVFKTSTDDMVMGSFCGLATPHSYHSKKVRQLRDEIFTKMMPHWADRTGAVEMLPDRVMLRPSTKRPTGESWHRDESPNTMEGIVTGGWVNLNDFPEYFCCVPGTHSVNGGNGGFAKIDKSEHAGFKARSKLIEVLPGHAIVFFENIVHKVFAGRKVTRWRQFVGWRFSTNGQPFDPTMFDRIKNFETLKIKSGQECPMYSRMHLTNWIERLAAWSVNIKDEHCVQHLVQSGKNAGKTFRICKRYISRSGTYTPYTPREIEILTPQWSNNEANEVNEVNEANEANEVEEQAPSLTIEIPSLQNTTMLTIPIPTSPVYSQTSPCYVPRSTPYDPTSPPHSESPVKRGVKRPATQAPEQPLKRPCLFSVHDTKRTNMLGCTLESIMASVPSRVLQDMSDNTLQELAYQLRQAQWDKKAFCTYNECTREEAIAKGELGGYVAGELGTHYFFFEPQSSAEFTDDQCQMILEHTACCFMSGQPCACQLEDDRDGDPCECQMGANNDSYWFQMNIGPNTFQSECDLELIEPKWVRSFKSGDFSFVDKIYNMAQLKECFDLNTMGVDNLVKVAAFLQNPVGELTVVEPCGDQEGVAHYTQFTDEL